MARLESEDYVQLNAHWEWGRGCEAQSRTFSEGHVLHLIRFRPGGVSLHSAQHQIRITDGGSPASLLSLLIHCHRSGAKRRYKSVTVVLPANLFFFLKKQERSQGVIPRECILVSET
jgi:hypothetical protein